ncbi:MAG TPA: TetR/AcrR family transcriptional regulator [bacterium]|nr:TetR/AcrR family transcriptional regulator [bacterium]HPR88119.1 TetR/AcrR family transcriptional regulator [bacterium]
MNPGKRDRILKAAISVFAERGFYNAKMEDIAREAGVAVGTTYLYFENKDDLMISIFEEEMAPIITRMRELLAASQSAGEKIATFIRSHLTFVEQNPDMAHLLEVEMRFCSKFILGYQGGSFKEYLDLIAAILVEGQIAGEFDSEIHPTIFKQIVFGAVDQIATTYTVSRSKRISLASYADEIAKVILNGIRKK